MDRRMEPRHDRILRSTREASPRFRLKWDICPRTTERNYNVS
jgi:hypothetical protein